MVDSTKPTRRSPTRIILIVAFLVILIALGIFLYAGWLGYQEAPKRIEVQDPAESTYPSYTLSPDQETYLLSYGYPQSFTILFYEEETANQGIQTVRLETWDYYTLGVGLTFINGALTSEDTIAWDSSDPLVPLPYMPEQFSAFMGLEEVIAAAGLDTYIEVPLNKELMQAGTLYYAESLSFGLQDDQLVYVEALAVIEQ